MAENLGRVAGWSVRRIGLGTLIGFGMLVVLLSSLVWWLNQHAGRAASPTLGATTLMALALGWLLARSRSPGWLAAFWAGLAGLFTVATLAGGLLRPMLALSRAAFSLSLAVRTWQPGEPVPDRMLTLLLAQDLSLRATMLMDQAVTWIGNLVRGAPGFDSLAAGLFWGLLLWSVAVWSAWWVRRRNKPVLAVLPAVAILATSLAFARGQLQYLVPSFVVVLGLLAWSQYSSRAEAWLQQGIDSAADIPFDLTLWAGAIVVVVSGLAMLTATPSPHQALRFARAWLVPRSQTAEDLGQSLGLAPGSGDAEQATAGGVLPRQHLLGSGPELGQRVVYLVRVLNPSDALNPAEDGGLYWRAAAYDVYNGRGWRTSPTTAADYPAQLGPPLPVGTIAYRWIEQEIRAVGASGLQAVRAGELARLDQPYALDLRAAPAGELDVFDARLQSDPAGGDYRALSWLPAPSEAELAAAGFDYPLWIAARYLELPAYLPQRVTELAREITAGKTTPYARARAIEAYLRAIPYTLEVPVPPADRDVVDYYLFDLRRGYCDYAATAMVVLARAVGLPARLVIGYAPGRFESTSGQFVITEAEAHSWPEIYFSGVGWVAFEPTGGRPPAALPGGSDLPSEMVSPPMQPGPDWPSVGHFLGLALAGLSVLAFAIWGWRIWLDRRQSNAAAIGAIYAQLRRSGRRLGTPDWPGLTPEEVAVSVGNRLIQLAWPEKWCARLSPAGEEARLLARYYSRAIYSPHHPDAETVEEARHTWGRLRWRLWIARLWMIRLGLNQKK
jgi:transglutaminase-like putative cysteine protease